MKLFGVLEEAGYNFGLTSTSQSTDDSMNEIAKAGLQSEKYLKEIDNLEKFGCKIL